MAETSMNSNSSRSHAVFSLYLEWIEESREAQGIQSKKRVVLNFVDLAGSERAKSTNARNERLKEGCAINKSLTVLGSVISSLSNKDNITN